MKGILPIRQSTVLEPQKRGSVAPQIGVITGVFLKFLANFALTGSGESYHTCGSYFTKGCLNVAEHHGISNLDKYDLSGVGKVYLQRFKKSCDRALCPVCWGDWANREKDKATQRLNAFRLKNLKPIHVMISVPKKDYGLTLAEMRVKVYKNLKSVRMLGGMSIYHPKRKNDLDQWFFSPHFHVIGYGWLQDIRKNYFANGYIVKNLGIRKTVEGTIFYQLSHCGISADHHTVTWFGALSYNKLKVIYKEPDPPVCPMCFGKLVQLLWVGVGDSPKLPDVCGIGFYDEPGGWMRKPKHLRTDNIDSGLGEF